MLQRNLLLTQQFEELAHLIIEDLHEPFGSVLLFNEQQEALVDTIIAIYPDSTFSIDYKILYVETILQQLAQKDEQPETLRAYFTKWLKFLNYEKQFFTPIPDDKKSLFLDSYLEDIHIINVAFANIDEQIELIDGYVKLSKLHERNILVKELKRRMQDTARLAKMLRSEFYVYDLPLEAQSIQMLLHTLHNYLQQQLHLVQSELANAKNILSRFAQLRAETHQFHELLEDERKEKLLELTQEDSRVILEISSQKLNQIEMMLGTLKTIFSFSDVGQIKSLLTVAPSSLSDLDLAGLMSDEVRQEKLNALARQLEETRVAYLDDIVSYQGECYIQYELLNEKLGLYRAKLLQACDAMAKVDNAFTESSLSLLPIPNTLLLEIHINALELEEQKLSEYKSPLAASYAALEWHADNEKQTGDVPATAKSVECYFALAALVNASVEFSQDIAQKKSRAESGYPDTQLERLAALAEAFIGHIKRDQADLPSLIAFIDLVLEDEATHALLFDSKLLQAMETLRSKFIQLHQVNESVEEEKVEKEKEPVSPISSPSSSGSLFSYFWPPAPVSPPQVMEPKLQEIQAHLPSSGKSFSK